MTRIDVPSLAVERLAQRYALLRPGLPRNSDRFAGELDLADDGFVVGYPGLAERVHPPVRDNGS